MFTQWLASLTSSDELVHVAVEVRVAHEGATLVLRQVTADTRWVTARACVKQNAELVVGNLVGLTTDALQVFLRQTKSARCSPKFMGDQTRTRI